MSIKLSTYWHMARHFSGGVNLTAQAAFCHVAGEFGGQLGNMAGSAEAGGHESYNIAQSAFAQALLIPGGCIRPSH